LDLFDNVFIVQRRVDSVKFYSLIGQYFLFFDFKQDGQRLYLPLAFMQIDGGWSFRTKNAQKSSEYVESFHQTLKKAVCLV